MRIEAIPITYDIETNYLYNRAEDDRAKATQLAIHNTENNAAVKQQMEEVCADKKRLAEQAL